MQVLTEGNRLGDVIKGESVDAKRLSREDVTVLSGQSLELGAVVGRIQKAVGSITNVVSAQAAWTACTTGIALGAESIIGDYTFTCAATASKTFNIKSPQGLALPQLVGTAAYTNPQINITLLATATKANASFKVGVAAGSWKVKALSFSAVDGSQNAEGILIETVDTTDTTMKSVAFTSGGTYVIEPGDLVEGATSGATARIVSISVSTGTWAGGNAAGALVLDGQEGTFQSENLDVGANANVATIGGNSAAYQPDRPGVIVSKDAVIDATNLVWPAGATDDQKEAALTQLADKGIFVRTAA